MRSLSAFVLCCLLPLPAAGQTTATAPTTSGTLSTAVQTVNNDSGSSRLSEYRDWSRRVFLPAMALEVYHPDTGWTLDLQGVNVGRRDQRLTLSAGRPGRYRVDAQWSELPHLYSNKARTPYQNQGGGLLTVPSTVPITFKKLATAAADAPGVVASDALVAAYQARALGPTPLGTNSEAGRLAVTYLPAPHTTLGASWERRTRTGTKSTFGPIGDRPPRTLNIQIAEPVDRETNDLTLSAEHRGRRAQLRAEYLYSNFANAIDTLRWQNVYANPAPGVEYDLWDRVVSAFGARPLDPDNRYHQFTLQSGLELGRGGFLAASGSVGRMEQDGTLLPYASGAGLLANRTLPQATAQATITTTHLSADYVVAVVPRLVVRGFIRSTGLDNETPERQWQYVTSDAYNLNGTVSYKNKRVNLAYATDRLLAGAEATLRFRPGRSSLSVGAERETLTRDYRETDTTEYRWRLSARTRPTARMNVSARFLLASREGDAYDYNVNRTSYWYALTEADQDNPAFTFSNHPDMRRFDVADRLRKQADVTVTMAAVDRLSVSAYVRYRSDDFETPVDAIQPLSGTTFAGAAARTPGDQLGWLKDSRLRYGADLFAQPTEAITVTAFLGYDRGTGTQRSLEFNENNKGNPATVDTAELGPWTRATSQWTADYTDRTWSGGAGLRLDLVANRAAVQADYTMSLSTVAMGYEGFGRTNWDGVPFAANHQFAFSAPPDIREDLQVLDLRLDLPCRQLVFMIGYRYEKSELDDWQQSGAQPWVETVGSDTFLRDTSRSHQWGNRLFNLGTYLAPGYSAHVGWMGLRFAF